MAGPIFPSQGSRISTAQVSYDLVLIYMAGFTALHNLNSGLHDCDDILHESNVELRDGDADKRVSDVNLHDGGDGNFELCDSDTNSA
jgi:hypothetical protein